MAKTIANGIPGAWIVSPKDRGRKSIRGGKVFLNDGDDFEIELYNPLTLSVLADIKLNGQSISKSGLVLKPGQRVYLDCFIDSRKKFKFSTYKVEDSEESKEAISKNGLLEIFFYKEDAITLDNWKNRFDKIVVEKWYPTYIPYNPYNQPNYKPMPIWYTYDTNVSYNSGLVNNVSTYSSGVDFTNLSTINTSTIETGRVEGGSKSKQEFTNVDMDFERHYIASTIIQILPESRKPVEVKTTKISIELPKGDWSKEDLEGVKEVVNNYLWKEDNEENKKDIHKNIDLIKKLAELHSAGILTDEEFSKKKEELLSKI